MIAHDPWLVALSVALAVQGAYVALVLAGVAVAADGSVARARLAGAALSLATGIWAMHFVGMLAADLPKGVDFLALPTLASFLICALVVGCGVYATSLRQARLRRIAGGGLFMGLGIAAMHYVGMLALHSGGVHLAHAPGFVLLAVLVAVIGSVFALWLIDRPGEVANFRARAPWVGAFVLGLAVAGMHYLAMAGMRLDAVAGETVALAPALSRGGLALIVAIVAFVISAGFLLALIPNGRMPAEPISALPVSDSREPAILAEAPARPASAEAPSSRELASLPVRREGSQRALPVAAVRAVRASGHYTTIFDGRQEYFCQLPIGAVEAALDPARYMRVHRSHIVSVDAIASLKRQGDEGIAELRAATRFSVPVARARYRELKRRLAALPAAASSTPGLPDLG